MVNDFDLDFAMFDLEPDHTPFERREISRYASRLRSELGLGHDAAMAAAEQAYEVGAENELDEDEMNAIADRIALETVDAIEAGVSECRCCGVGTGVCFPCEDPRGRRCAVCHTPLAEIETEVCGVCAAAREVA